MRPDPPITQLHWEEQSLSTLSTLTDRGALMRATPTYKKSSYQLRRPSTFTPHSRSLSPRRSKRMAPSKQKYFRDDSPPTAHETDVSDESGPPRRGFFTKKSSSSGGRSSAGKTQPVVSPSAGMMDAKAVLERTNASKKGKRTVTTLKRTKKTRSELPQSSPRIVPFEETKYHHSLSPRRSAPTLHPASHPPDVGTRPLSKVKSTKYRTEYYNDRHRELSAEQDSLEVLEQYKVDISRVRSMNAHTSSVISPPDLADGISETSSSIFADLDKEEESTIWGDLEEQGNRESRQTNQHRRRRRLATQSIDESEQYGEVRLPTRRNVPRHLDTSDISSVGGEGVSTVGDQKYFEADAFFADPISMCMFMQDVVARDCSNFMRC